MRDVSFYKKWLVCVALVTQVLLTGCGSLNSSFERDCGYSVTIYKNEDEQTFNVVVSMVMAEILDDKMNCGFGEKAVKVNGLQIADSQLIEEIVIKGEPAYRFKGDFDPQKAVISFSAENKGYLASPVPAATPGSVYHLYARKFPPK